MLYFVTHGTGPAAIDPDLPDTESALEHASRLLAEGRLDVAIQDGNGRRISGADLVDCCAGKRKLTPDLRAI